MSLSNNPTRQEVLNFVVTAMRKQGKLSYTVTTDGKNCKYRSEDGCKCPVGHIIPDEHYLPIFEGKRIFAIIDILENTMLNFLTNIQYCHDNNHVTTLAEFEYRLRELAMVSNLEYPELQPEAIQ